MSKAGEGPWYPFYFQQVMPKKEAKMALNGHFYPKKCGLSRFSTKIFTRRIPAVNISAIAWVIDHLIAS